MKILLIITGILFCSFAKAQMDTMPVLILYSDTGKNYTIRKTLYFKAPYVRPDTLDSYIIQCVYWMKGFVVSKRNRTYPSEMPDWDDPTQYLDAEKKKIKNTFVVWHVKYLFK